MKRRKERLFEKFCDEIVVLFFLINGDKLILIKIKTIRSGIKIVNRFYI